VRFYHRMVAVEGIVMKVNVEFDCTPEEARRLMGLPDMAPIHDLYLERLKQTMSEGISPEMIDRLMRTWAPLGDAGMNFWTRLFDQATAKK
jgi:hypothetical protein